MPPSSVPSLQQVEDVLASQLTLAVHSFEIFESLSKLPRLQSQYGHAIDRCKHFFGPTIEAHQRNFVVCLATLHDTGGTDRITFKTFVELLGSHHKLPFSPGSLTLEQIKTQYIRPLQPLVQKLACDRNRFVGHRLSSSLEPRAHAEALCSQQYSEILEGSILLLNSLSTYFRGHCYPLKVKNPETVFAHTVQVVGAVASQLAHQRL